MEQIQVVLDKRIPFNITQVYDGENVIFCKSFKDELFNTGSFSTKDKDFVHKYIIEDNKKYIITDVSTTDGRTYKNVKFQIVLNEREEIPFSTFNPRGSNIILENVVLPENKITDDLEILEKTKSNDFDKKRLEQIEERLENKKNRLINEEKQILNKKTFLKEEKEKAIQEQKEKENDLQEKYKIIREAKNDIIASSRQYLEEKLKTSSEENKNYARRILELGGGGGSVAVQYANGGTMNGYLNVNGTIGAIGGNSNQWNSTYTTTNTNSGSWANTYTLTATNFSVTDTSNWAVDTFSAVIQCTLPASPQNGTIINFLDTKKTWATQNLVLLRNSQLIESLTENLSCNINGYSFSLIYVGGSIGWRIAQTLY